MKLLKNVRLSIWRAFLHDAFGVAKGGAYSAILTMFPALMVSASILATTRHGPEYVREISGAVRSIMPPGAAGAVEAYFESTQRGRSVCWWPLP